jgi:predicted deacylase
MACEYVCGVPAKEYWGGVGLQCFLVGAHGIPAVLSESDDPESHYKDIRNILVHLKMLDGELVRRPKIYQKTLHLLTATRSGIFVPEVDLYQRVDKGQLLARILNPSGEVVEEIHCPIANGLVVTIRTFPTVEAVWEKTIQGTTLEKAGLFEIGELASW